MSTWFTSDIHLQQEKVAQYRGYPSAAYHDLSVREIWNQLVKSSDVIWILGDFGQGNLKTLLEFGKTLTGRKRLVLGNHDKAFPGYRDAWKFLPAYMEVFETATPFARIAVPGKTKRRALLSHFPYDGDHTQEERFVEYRLRDCGMWLLHGHTHSPERIHGRQIHVGIDAWPELVRLEEIGALIEEREACGF